MKEEMILDKKEQDELDFQRRREKKMQKSKLNEFLTGSGFFEGAMIGLLLFFIIILILNNSNIEPLYISGVLFLLAIFAYFLTKYYEKQNKIIGGE